MQAKDSAQDLSKLSIEDNFGHKFFIAPHRHTKTLYLVRHGEGYNLHGEPSLGGDRPTTSRRGTSTRT